MPEKKTILVVEDEPLIGLELQETLVRLGYEVPRVIGSADEILTAASSVKPDLVLMDINLKSFSDGIDAARRLRLFSDKPIIFLTAYSGDDTRARAASTSPAAFLSKPVDEATLVASIKKALAG
jgi:CheY-like chemotaxis protein